MEKALAVRPHRWHGLSPGARCPEVGAADVLTDRPVSRGEIVLDARPIGGLRMVEGGEANDTVIAVLLGDPTFGELPDVGQLPRAVVDRLRHSFLTCKAIPGETATITVDPVYDAPQARAVLAAARDDYRRRFGEAGT